MQTLNPKCFLRQEVKNIKAGLYARVSTDSQLEGYSIDAQKEFLLSYAKSKEFTEFEYYVDGGFSGKNLERPAIQKLIEDVKNKKLDCVIVFKLDRISRSQKDTLYLIEEVFNKYNVGFISMRENFDTTSPFGKAMIGVLSVFAQLERETIIERTRIGLKKRIESGLWRGGGKIPFPYDYDKERGILVPNKEKTEILHKMISLYLEGASFPKLSKMFNMTETLIEKRILSITNTGKIPYNDEVFEGQHEPVVSEELYNEILRVNKARAKEKYKKHYLLSGKIFCAQCGARYRYQKWGKRVKLYCYSQQKSKPKLIKDPNCLNKSWDSFEVEDVVLENLFELGLDQDKFNTTFNMITVSAVDEFNKNLENINSKIKNLIEFISKGIAVEDASKKISKLEEEREIILNEIKKARKNKSKKKHIYNKIKNISEVWNYMSFEEQRSIIDLLIDKITIDNNVINIYYKID